LAGELELDGGRVPAADVELGQRAGRRVEQRDARHLARGARLDPPVALAGVVELAAVDRERGRLGRRPR
jgi:hypothetical protein